VVEGLNNDLEAAEKGGERFVARRAAA
jgi:hypothetical protein